MSTFFVTVAIGNSSFIGFEEIHSIPVSGTSLNTLKARLAQAVSG